MRVVAFTIAASLMIAPAIAGTPIDLSTDPPKAQDPQRGGTTQAACDGVNEAARFSLPRAVQNALRRL